jgi:excisionase family DNA binding protein
MEKEFYTVKEVMALLQISEPTARRLLDSGQIPAVRVGELIRIPKEGLEASLETYKRAPNKRGKQRGGNCDKNSN